MNTIFYDRLKFHTTFTDDNVNSLRFMKSKNVFSRK